LLGRVSFERSRAWVGETDTGADPRANRGYVAIGRERVTQSSDEAEIASLRAKAPDCKETMEIGRDWDATWQNRWPQESDAPGFKPTMLAFYQVWRSSQTLDVVLAVTLARRVTTSTCL
jgi:hypothetical protein